MPVSPGLSPRFRSSPSAVREAEESFGAAASVLGSGSRPVSEVLPRARMRRANILASSSPTPNISHSSSQIFAHASRSSPAACSKTFFWILKAYRSSATAPSSFARRSSRSFSAMRSRSPRAWATRIGDPGEPTGIGAGLMTSSKSESSGTLAACFTLANSLAFLLCFSRTSSYWARCSLDSASAASSASRRVRPCSCVNASSFTRPAAINVSHFERHSARRSLLIGSLIAHRPAMLAPGHPAKRSRYHPPLPQMPRHQHATHSNPPHSGHFTPPITAYDRSDPSSLNR